MTVYLVSLFDLILFPSQFLTNIIQLQRELVMIMGANSKFLEEMTTVWQNLQPKIAKLTAKEAENSSRIKDLLESNNERLKKCGKLLAIQWPINLNETRE